MVTAGTTHHIVLNDGSTQIGLMGYSGGGQTFAGWRRTPMMSTSIKTSTGEQGYSDLEMPYYTIAQDNFEGGRGQEKLDDKTRFYDSHSMWTATKDAAILAPRPMFCDMGTHYDEIVWESDSDIWNTEIGDATTDRAAQRFTTDSTGFTATSVWLALALNRLTDDYIVTVHIRPEDGSGTYPSETVSLGSTTIPLSSIKDYQQISWVKATFSSGIVLAASTSYYITIELSWDEPRQTAGRLIWAGRLYSSNQNDNALASCLGGGDEWDFSGYTRGLYRFNEGQGYLGAGHEVVRFIEYHGALYALTKPENKSAAGKIWLNGDVGVADSNSGALTKLIDDSKSGTWTNDQWNGCVVKIIHGTGDGEWRTITDTVVNPGGAAGSKGYLTVDTPWSTTHDTTTFYAILGSDEWTDVTSGAGAYTIDKPVTDAVVINGYMMIAQGNGQPMLWYSNGEGAGSYHDIGADAADSAAGILLLTHWTNKQWRIYRIYKDGTLYFVDWAFRTWSVPSFADVSGMSIPDGTPTGMVLYNGMPYIFTDRGVYAIYQDEVVEVDIKYGSMMDSHNGVNPTVFNSFMFFPLGYGLMRTNGTQVDSVGPNRDTGMPAGRQGRIADMCAAVDLLYCALDGGDSGTSSVLTYNSFGWHELARGIGTGERIKACHYQVIPNGPNKLWYGEGDTIRYINMPSKTSNPWFDSDITFAPAGELITSWIDIGMAEAEKFFHEVRVVGDNSASIGDYFITSFYQTDTDTDSDSWHYIGLHAFSNSTSTQSITSDDSLSGRRIRLKFVLTSRDATKTPRIRAWALNAVARLQPKYSYATSVIISDNIKQMNGDMDATGATTILAQLDAWADAATPLTMTSIDGNATSKKVFVEPMDYRMEKSDSDADGSGVPVYIGTLKLIEA